MSSVEIIGSPLLPSGTWGSIYYREWGSGFPLIFLHGGWGYEVYPFDSQIEAFASRFRILIPDRTGYGRSTRVESFSSQFHAQAAIDARLFLDALGIERCILWGHSDGAVIAANMVVQMPQRYAGIILEAIHHDREKPGSRQFFEGTASGQIELGERVRSVLALDHGENDWLDILKISGRAWLDIAHQAGEPEFDLFAGRLGDLSVPTLLIHGAVDPRTEPGELDRVCSLLPHPSLSVVPGGGHAPHTERDVSSAVNRIACEFLERIPKAESE